MKIGVYVSHLNKIGGVETSAINLCNRTGWDLIFNSAELNSLAKLKFNFYNQIFVKHTYDVIILQTCWGAKCILNAKKYIQVIHADYEAYIEGWDFIYDHKKDPRTNYHIAVSQLVAEKFEKVTKYKIDKVIYNLLDGEKEYPKKAIPKKDTLRLVTVSRISKEKGFERMLKMAELLDGEKYTWEVYGCLTTNKCYSDSIIKKFKEHKNIMFKDFTDKPLEKMAEADYLVQLSDTEGFSYSLQESLKVKTPVITTNYPASYELIKDGENGYILDMDLSNFSLEKIKKIPTLGEYKEKSTEKDWFNFIKKITKE